jgi:nitrogen fixation NifU-like protein
MASEIIKGQPLEVAARLTNEQVAAALGGLPEAKMHCSVLAADALRAALEDYYHKHPEARGEEH